MNLSKILSPISRNKLLYRALTDLYDVLTDIHGQPRLKQMLWRGGISVLVSRVYEVLKSASFNVGNPLRCKSQSITITHL